jgi:hypothetical protein
MYISFHKESFQTFMSCLQFRQSIKRIFGMHSKGKQSQTEKGYNNTLMSPAHKMSLNNDTTRYVSETTISAIPKKVKDNKRIIFSDNITEVNNESNCPFPRDLELCTINENRTASDAERSGETIYEDDSANSNKKLDLFGESCKLFNKRSPILTIVDTDHFVFSKPVKSKDDDADSGNNAYGNEAFEDPDVSKYHDFQSHRDHERGEKQKMIKHSYSLDLSAVSNEKSNRKLSIETKLETLIEPKGFFKDTIISKFFEPEPKPDGIKSYLCNVDDVGKNENNL